ncbi:helix-turn-helix domain-containing protein [Streptomyces pseudogriseolus]|uniref:helix-turn-helix domain-containing protein n=1 Tax=Streptomyces pseudogriseolus TaxID=36817 RepID=UPI002B3FFF98|nr:helix-turn-helix domain-containing protein [Streptomyces gancidicus]
MTELAVACAVPKSTAHRLLEQLVALGAVERRGARYRLGAQLSARHGSRTQDCAWRDACRCTGPHNGAALNVRDAGPPHRSRGNQPCVESLEWPPPLCSR